MDESKQERIDRLLREGLNYYGTGDVAEAVRSWREVLTLDPGHEEAHDYLETAGEPVGSEAAPAPPAATAAPAARHQDAGAGGMEWGLRDLGEDDAEAPAPQAPPQAAAPPAAPSIFDPPLLDAAPAPAPPAPPAPPSQAGAPSSGGSPLDALAREAMQLLRDGDSETALDLFETLAARDPSRIEVQSYIEMLRSRLLKSYRERVGDDARIPRQRIDGAAVMRYDLPAKAGFVLSLVDGTTAIGDLVSLSGLDAFETLRILSCLMEAGIVELAP